jgi:hypothetical protein
VHGYNVNFNQSRDRNAEIFKRLYQMGNDSKYVAVSWTGDVSQIGGGNAVICPDYWRNVYNAFASSSPLAHKINGLTGSAKSKTVIAAHSLGNMVVSSAICDHGLKAEKYFMMNSAVAKEAYIPSIITTEHNVMSHPYWRTDPHTYPDKLWASNWHDLFTDARRNLTWQGRFESLKTKTSPWNYYSTGETTAAASDGSLPLGVLVNGKKAWVAQEMFKGSTLQGIVAGWYKGAWDSHGGWGFNPNRLPVNPLNPPAGFPPVPNPIDNDGRLRADPFFDPFTVLKLENGGANPDSNGTPVTDPNQGAAAHAAQYSVRAWMLAYEIPAISNPTASGRLIPPFGNEYGGSTDMNTELRDGVWGAWEHGGYLNDIDHVWKLYNDWTTKGNLRK